MADESDLKSENRKKLFDKLTDLGPLSTLVAERLLDKGVKGTRRDPASCPLANYLEGEWPDDWQVAMGVVQGTIDGIRVSVPMPPAIRTFVRYFDGGKYPALET